MFCHLAKIWPGLAIGHLANLAGQTGQKNPWPWPNANTAKHKNTKILVFNGILNKQIIFFFSEYIKNLQLTDRFFDRLFIYIKLTVNRSVLD